MKIAIVGAGFSGLATAWHLLQYKSIPIKVTLFDRKGIGGGASGIAAGLMHPYAGAHAKLNRFGYEGWKATCELLNMASQSIGISVADFSGIFRIAVTEEQEQDYAYCHQRYPDVHWVSSDACQKMIPYVVPRPGIFIPSGVTVNSSLYLKALWKSCELQGAILKEHPISTLHELKEFDFIVIAAGGKTTDLEELRDLPITKVKGQILELLWPEQLTSLPFSLNSQAYLAMSPGKKSCFAGSTFERTFSSLEPVPEIAVKEILPKITQFFPCLNSCQILDCQSGLRASTPDHLPLIIQVNKKCWVFTGMGSKGLLYHALYGQRLAHEIVQKAMQ